MTDNQKQRFMLLNTVDTYRLKDRLEDKWYQFDTADERDQKIKELEDEQNRKGV